MAGNLDRLCSGWLVFLLGAAALDNIFGRDPAGPTGGPNLGPKLAPTGPIDVGAIQNVGLACHSCHGAARLVDGIAAIRRGWADLDLEVLEARHIRQDCCCSRCSLCTTSRDRNFDPPVI